MTQIAAVILAAGASTRFGSCKQLLDWGGRPLLAHVADLALQADLDPVAVVLGCRADETYHSLGDRPVLKLVNRRWGEGMSTSVKTGLAAVPPNADGALFLQCDQPLITVDLLRTIVDRFSEIGALIVHPVHGERRGTPVLFSRRLFLELSQITGDQGGRGLIPRHDAAVATVAVGDPKILADIDTPADHHRLKPTGQERGSSAAGGVLRPIRHALIDMDGVLWRGDDPLPGVKRLFSFLKRHHVGFILATNNASRTPDQYARRLADLGVEVGLESILTSALVVAAYLEETAPPGSRVYALGEEGLRRAVEGEGFVVASDEADYVVVGWDRQLTYEKLVTASLLIDQGAAFLATNPDLTFPTRRGPIPGTGAILAAVEAATGKKPIVTGKPEPRMYQEALRRMDATPETTVMIGDRIDTDITGASRFGLTTVLTLSGIASAEDVETSSIKPDFVCQNLDSLVTQWEEALA